MTNHLAVKFEKEANCLFHDRIHWLLKIVGGNVSKRPPRFNRYKVDVAIDKLQQIATACIAEAHLKKEFKNLIRQKKQWHIKGHGRDKKKNDFSIWFDKNIKYNNFVYMFWQKNKCLYIGKTENGKGRAQDHFKEHWFSYANRIAISCVSAPSQVLKLECLAKHQYDPSYNKNDPPQKKWYKKCPVCKTRIIIHDEIRKIFGIKKSG